MATGYTAAIEKGIGFEAFVMRCARSIGHLVGLRDMSLDAPIPERLEPSTYHSDMLAQASDRLARLMGMGSEEAEQEAAKQDVKRSQSNTKHAKDQEVLLAKYRRMLDMVQAWQPPSDDHVVLKKFMVQQLEDSIGSTLRHLCRILGHVKLARSGWRMLRRSHVRISSIIGVRTHSS